MSSITTQSDSTPSLLILLLLCALIGFVPFVIFFHIAEYQGIVGEILGKTQVSDYFVHYKMIWLYITTAFAILWYVAWRRDCICWYHRSLVVYSAMAILATVFAKYPGLALEGDPQRYEGLFVHLCYMAAVFLFANLLSSQRALNFVLTFFFISITVMATLGVGQFFGCNYFFSAFGWEFLVPESLSNGALANFQMRQTPDLIHKVFLTFGNSNYAGIYLSMVFPFSLALFLGCQGWKKWPTLLANILVYLSLLGCSARAATLAAVVGGLLTVLIFRFNLKSQIRWVLVLLAFYAVIPFIMDAYTLRKDLPRFFSTSTRPLLHALGSIGRFEDLVLDGNTATATFDGVPLTVKFKDGKIGFFDQSGEQIAYRMEKINNASGVVGISTPLLSTSSPPIPSIAPTVASGEENPLSVSASSVASDSIPVQAQSSVADSYLVRFPPGQLPGFIIQVWPQSSIIQIGRGGVRFSIGHTLKGFKLLDGLGRVVEITPVEAWGFKGLEGFGSGRGYIWSRSLPLLKKTLLVGFGPDTFIAHFPNHDYLGKLRHWDAGLGIIVEKPHNLYLQIAINIGVIALIAMLIMWGGYLLESARLYFNCDFDNQLNIYGAAIFVAVFAYLVNAMFNDSIVGIAQVFWALLGMGFAVNRMLLREKADKDRETASSTVVSSQ